MQKFILSIDQGTTGTTALLIDQATLEMVGKVNQEFPQIFPKPGWVEHDLDDIWNTVGSTIKNLLEQNDVNSNQITSIGITNQRETTCAYDVDGKALANAIVWQDRRTSDFCHEHIEAYQVFQEITGLPLDPYFSGTKMRWLLDHNDDVKAAEKSNKLRLSTIDSFLLYRMTQGEAFATEPSNASRTLLMNLDTCQWDDKLLDFFQLSSKYLPEIKNSFGTFGETKGLSFLPDGVPISCILGDQQAALFGQAGISPGDLKCTYGTGAFILLNTGDRAVFSDKGLLTTVAFKHQDKAYYALEGSSYIAGAAVQWLRDNLALINSAPSVENLANSIKSIEDMEHLLFLPFFSGIGSPYWKADAKGAILGITRDTSKPQLARACLDGIALAVNDSVAAMVKESPYPVPEIRVDGGASLNNLLMQLQANFSQKSIIRPKVIETTAYGVALGAMVGQGETNLEKVKELWQQDQSFKSEQDEYFLKKQQQWDSAIKKLFL